LLVLLILLIYTIFAINSCLEKFEDKDPKQIVIDEVIGQSIPIYIYEISHGTEKSFDKSILFYFFIFVLFRIFDILKPFPINYFDRKYKNTFGIMFDDILAGFYVVLTLILAMIVKNLL
jgi:phosphatidylglycerophosphatase A